MNGIDKIIEEKIKQAMKDGSFDNLRGAGKPLRLEDDPHEDPTWRLAGKLLRDNGFSLPWIKTWREIEAELEAARREYRQVRKLYESNRAASQGEWAAAQEKFKATLESLNRRIFGYNLQVPLPAFQRPLIDSERELAETA